MECNEVQDDLNNYIEGLLPSEATKLFEEHIASCKKCSESLADLRKTISHIKDLEEMEPPIWLTQKVMSKIREEAEVQQKKGIFGKLLSIFSANMPLKAAAAVAIAVVTIYIFKDIQPAMKTVKPAIEETTEQKEQERYRAAKKEKMVQEPATVGKAEKKDSSMPYAGSPMPAAGYGSYDRFSEAQRSPATALEQDRNGSSVFAPSPASPAKKDMSDEAGQEAKTAYELMAAEENKSYDISITVNVEDLAHAKKEVWEIVSQSGGKVTKTESYKDRYVFSAELDTARVKELNEKLKNIGEVKQKDSDPIKTHGKLSVKIEIARM